MQVEEMALTQPAVSLQIRQLEELVGQPAEIGADGYQAWYKNGEVHRDGDKPAEIGADGKQYWFKNGQLIASSQQEYNAWKARQRNK